MKMAGIIIIVLAYLIGFLLIVIPAIGIPHALLDGSLSEWWASSSKAIITGIVTFILLLSIGNWLKSRAKKRAEQTNDDR